jgi:hypothetical protein
VNARFIDWIWHVRGRLALAPGTSSDEAFARLDPLFRETGTSQARSNGTLTFRKKDPAAQDKLSVFEAGTLRIEKDVAGPVLYYHLTSRALLFCFLAPLLFLSFAGLTVALSKLEKPPVEAAQKKSGKKDAVVPQNPIDKFLGAPAPEKPDEKKKKEGGGRKHSLSPTSAYVFAGIFAVLYIGGRILEEWLVKRLFRQKLLNA